MTAPARKRSAREKLTMAAVAAFALAITVGSALLELAAEGTRKFDAVALHCQSLAKSGEDLFKCGSTSQQRNAEARVKLMRSVATRTAEADLKRKVAEEAKAVKLEGGK